MITTGGTIASQEGEDGLEPKTTGQQMLDLIPELQSLCEIDCVDLLNLDSTNMQPEEWAVMAKAAFEGMKNHDGIVITHGTDTLDETAYFLTLTLNTPKPVVLTGAMRPATATSADGPFNLYQAICLACHGESYNRGVLALFSNTI